MKNRSFILLLFLSILQFSSKEANAILLTVEDKGQVVINVLADTDSIALGESERSDIQVRKIIDSGPNGDSTVSLVRKDGLVNLTVFDGTQLSELKVNNPDENLIEIEERPSIQKINIGIKDDKFSFEQNGITALTALPVKIDAKRAVLALTTTKGDEFLSVMPYEAVESALRTRLLTEAFKTQVEINEDAGRLQYKINGQKVIDLFGVYQYTIPITTYVSTSTGEVLSMDSSTWFKYLRFLYI